MTPMKDVFSSRLENYSKVGYLSSLLVGKQYPDASVMVNTPTGVSTSTELVGSISTGRSRFESWVSGFIFLFTDLRLSLIM